jgi:pimeloyl-ACP methyl ester carboxylesterase
MQTRTLYATFVGINAYPQGALSGCIKDVLDLDLLLREQCAQQGEDVLHYRPAYFLAPNAADLVRISEYETANQLQLTYKTPTFKLLTEEAFAHFSNAKAGDICLFYYSGHGSQTPAPEGLQDKMLETLVCVDSRSEARDLVDKELGYLLWKAFTGKGVHALVIMDCCHSGNNTRSAMINNDVRFRFWPSDGNKVPMTSWLGHAEGFYVLKDGKISINIPPYIHFASCRNDEKAQETMNGGLFTSKLVEVLRAGGTSSSYRQLMQSLSVTVRGRAERQSPVAFSQQDTDLDQQFLSNAVIPYKPSFEVRYHAREKQWRMYGGAMHGILTSAVMRIGKADVPVAAVFPAYSLLDGTAMSSFDTAGIKEKAVVLKRGEPAMIVRLAENAGGLQQVYDTHHYPYFRIDNEGALYIVELWGDSYILRGIDNRMPLFQRERDPATFLENVNKVGNWQAALELKNASPALTADDFVFNWEIAGEPVVKRPGDEVLLSYKNGEHPVFRLNIALNPASRVRSCFVKVLYLGSKYSIDGSLVRNDANELKPGSPVQLTFNYEGETYDTIGVSIDEAYQYYGINEITDFLKIIVSDVEVNLDQYQQEGLLLDVPPEVRTRDIAPPGKAGKTVDQPNWSVFTFSIRCTGPKKEQVLQAGSPADFAAFTVEAPAGFSARASAVTADEQTGTRSYADIWDGVLAANTPFAQSIHPVTDSSIRMLELFQLNDAPLVIPEGKELVIRPATASRSLDDELVVPYGYDPQLEMYIPLGYADDQGNIHIEQLPPPVSDERTRSLGGSIKLLFKKLVRSKEVNRLRIYKRNDQSWEETKTLQNGKAVLLIHGITGDTRYMAEAFRNEAGQYIDFLMTYDYENLATPVSKTAEKLHEQLQAAGVQGLTIVAHSMGGLVARWLAEQVPGTGYIKRLVLVGSPCAGSEMAALSTAAFGMLTQALNLTGPVKYAITGLSWLLKQLKLHPGETLNELKPGSKLLQTLSASKAAPGVEYRILGGDTALLQHYNGDDPFLKRILSIAKDKILYPALTQRIYEKEPNDMAVTLASMRAIPSGNGEIRLNVVASNHLAYFREKESLGQILSLL